MVRFSKVGATAELDKVVSVEKVGSEDMHEGVQEKRDGGKL